MERRGARFGAVIGAAALVLSLAGAAGADQAPGDSVRTQAPGDSARTQAPGDSARARAAAPAAEPGKGVHQYVGVKKCKTCHSSEKVGAQYKQWAASKHAKAYETLGTDFAKGIAKKKGIADPQTSSACLQCHQTGFGEPSVRFAGSFVATDGVQCESCHGAGKDYVARKTMQGIADGTLKGEDYGLVLPTKDRCVGCHNEQSPTFVEMNFSTDSTKVAHPNPKRAKRAGGKG